MLEPEESFENYNFIEFLTQLNESNHSHTNDSIMNNQTSWTIHSPQTRNVFQQLKTKLKDIDLIYKKKDIENVETTNSDDENTTEEEIFKNSEKMKESVTFFKEQLKIKFSKFVDSQSQCEKEEAFLFVFSSIIDGIQNQNIEEQDFNECASSICKSIETFTQKKINSISTNVKKKNKYWSQYQELRDMCKLIHEVQSDIVCRVCMENEIEMALNCGHCFCTTCASQCNACPNCRTFVTQKLKLFF